MRHWSVITLGLLLLGLSVSWQARPASGQADVGSGFLVSKQDYGDFQLRAEFWVDATANSGIFIRASDPKRVTAENA